MRARRELVVEPCFCIVFGVNQEVGILQELLGDHLRTVHLELLEELLYLLCLGTPNE